MNKKQKNNNSIILGIIILVCIVLWLFNNFRNNNTLKQSTTQSQQIIDSNAKLTYTKHALCRMACRSITENEIREVLKEGIVNYKKSNKNDSPCPTYAIEDRVQDGQMLRIVFGVCNDRVKVITCIDIENEYDCECK